MSYYVDKASLEKNFPPHFPPPQLLLDFADWLETIEDGSLGWFGLESERFNDYWIENGVDLHDHFAFFMRDPTGGQVGFWLYDGKALKGAPPVVLVGSEGELEVIAESLEEFLAKMSTASTEVSDLDERDEDADSSAELEEWLRSRSAATPVGAAPPRALTLQEWMDKFGEEQRKQAKNDPSHTEIAERLRRYVKPNAEPWETANFDVLCVGSNYKMWHRVVGPQPMPEDEAQALEPLFRAVRLQRAQKLPERGLWFSAYVSVGKDGPAQLRCNFLDDPASLFMKPQVVPADFKLDAKEFPRSGHWTPDWLAQTLN